ASTRRRTARHKLASPRDGLVNGCLPGIPMGGAVSRYGSRRGAYCRLGANRVLQQGVLALAAQNARARSVLSRRFLPKTSDPRVAGFRRHLCRLGGIGGVLSD